MENLESNILASHMGASFSNLSPLLRKVHEGKKRIEGEVNVEHGNIIAKIICFIFRFPKENSKTHLVVNCYHSGNSMKWYRDFDGHKMQSHFYSSNGCLVEKLGPLDLYFHPTEEDGALIYKFGYTKLFGIPMPKFLGPIIRAREYESEGRYSFEVRVYMFCVGLVLAYAGSMQLIDEEIA